VGRLLVPDFSSALCSSLEFVKQLLSSSFVLSDGRCQLIQLWPRNGSILDPQPGNISQRKGEGFLVGSITFGWGKVLFWPDGPID